MTNATIETLEAKGAVLEAHPAAELVSGYEGYRIVLRNVPGCRTLGSGSTIGNAWKMAARNVARAL